jgi:glycosyltransferase involved in cell wall biosynthesis
MYVVQSEWHKQDIATAFDISPDKIFVIPNPVAGDKCFVGTKNNDRLKLLYTSQLPRGLHILSKALEYMEDDNFDIYVNNARTEGVDLFPEHVEFSDRFIYRGRLDRDEYLEDLANTDIMCYPCVWEETFCIVAAEALASGVRVVTTNVGALPETTGGYARIVELPDRDSFTNGKQEKKYNDECARRYAKVLDEELRAYREGKFDPTEQIEYVKRSFNDGVLRKYWEELDKKLAPRM